MRCKNTLKQLGLLLVALLVNIDAYAVPTFLDSWRSFYPNSQSSDIDCQLCHQRTDGGDGWNSYGWLIRENYINFGRTSIELAFEESEPINSDQDEKNLSNIEEIELSLFPGWVNTNTNMIIFSNFSVLTNQPPPFLEMEPGSEQPERDSFCFPLKVSSENFVVVCL